MLDTFFNPSSIAVIGASHTPGKIGYEILSNILKSNFKGKVYPVNPNVTSILGIGTYKSIKEIESPIDLAIISLPAPLVPEVLSDCVKKKVKSVIIVSGGFSEIGEKGKKLENELKNIISRSQTRVLGPNVLGIYDSYTGLNTIFLPRERVKMPEKGIISIISQSGSIASTLIDVLGEHRIGISKFISYGNAMDIDESDLIEYLGNDSNTKIIAAFIEGVKNGKKFINTVRSVSNKKPIVILKGGKTEYGSKAALSHTGALAGSYKIYSSVFKQLGVIEAKTWEEFLDFSKAFLQPVPKGDRIVIVTDGGGWGVLATDEAEKLNLKLPPPSEKLKKILAEDTSEISSLNNPIDVVGDTTVERFKSVMEALLASNEYDGMILISLFHVPTLETTIIDVIESMKVYGKPILCSSVGSEFSTRLIRILESRGIPVYESPERAVRAMKALVDYGKIIHKK
jgi:acetyl coenzyme A synthetase (ADP forming)-like protein